MVRFVRKLIFEATIPKASVFDELGMRLRNEKPFIQMDFKDINDMDAS